MRTSIGTYVLLLFLTGFHFQLAFSQELDAKGKRTNDWFIKDPEIDRVQGISAERAYETVLKNQPSRTVIVAVIDSGIDIEHEDLKDVIWTNEKEIEGNGIDDDNNGYVDDIHGWNFIGGKEGNVNEDTSELTREYVRLQAKYEDMEGKKISKRDRDEYEQYQKIKTKYETLLEKNAEQYELYNNLYENVSQSVDTLSSLLQTDSLTQEAVKSFETSDPTLLFSKGMVLNIYKNIGADETVEGFLSQLEEATTYFGQIVNYGYNREFNPRTIIGDDYSNPYEKGYGNNDVEGPDAMHGTHVAGIIGANRNNDIGIKGIADNVKIMSVRTVPNGDERDKDVANAIIYAVDNGAQVINMSFGKSISPQKGVVDKAVKYAEQKGVILVHAAGNDSDNIDEKMNYPSRYYLNGKEAKNWIEVGASSWGADKDFVGSFSNYGKKSVDLFAPGVSIYSTTLDNTYRNQDGTSMASPVVTGVVAVILSYFPEFSTQEVIDIILQSSRKFDNLKITQPGGKKDVEFSELSKTGGLVNLYEAVKQAQQVKTQRLTK